MCHHPNVCARADWMTIVCVQMANANSCDSTLAHLHLTLKQLLANHQKHRLKITVCIGSFSGILKNKNRYLSKSKIVFDNVTPDFDNHVYYIIQPASVFLCIHFKFLKTLSTVTILGTFLQTSIFLIKCCICALYILGTKVIYAPCSYLHVYVHILINDL